MTGGKHLLLLAVFVLLARCQQTPQVSISPAFKQFFIGDVFYVSCDDTSGGSAKLYHNGTETALTNKTLKVAVASLEHSGSYQCERNGQKSVSVNITVLEYIPSASLTIKTGHPVMHTGGSVILQLDNEDGLEGWECWVYREGDTKRIVLRLEKDSVSLVFQPRSLDVPETIFWCTNRDQKLRSNQITVRTSGKRVSLEMYPLPAVVGESLTLSCLAWGTNKISRTVFYKDGKEIQKSDNPIHISNVTESEKGEYKCYATFTYTGRTTGQPYKVTSDNQEVLVQATPKKADLSANVGLSCSCPLCPSGASYRWYSKNDDGQSWALIDSGQGFMMPKASGTYACRAVWNNMRTLLSRSYVYHPPIKSILTVAFIVLTILGLIVAAGAFYIWYKKRNTTGPIYEDVALRSRDKGDDKYETLQKPRGAQREGEYDTLHPEAPGRERKEGEYEPLNKEGMKGEVYHTLGTEGAGEGAGGYEALKKEGRKEGVYHTLGSEGAAGGAGGYEALKKEGMKEGVYHTLGSEGAAGGAGGYEALKKERMKEGVYHTLGTEGAGGGEGAYEAAGKKDKDGEYETVEEKRQAKAE